MNNSPFERLGVPLAGVTVGALLWNAPDILRGVAGVLGGMFATFVFYHLVKGFVGAWRARRTPVVVEEESTESCWVGTAEDGTYREMVTLEVPREVRVWSKRAEMLANLLHEELGVHTIVLGAIPRAGYTTDDALDGKPPYTCASIANDGIHPIAFMEMAASFERQVPQILAAQGQMEDHDD